MLKRREIHTTHTTMVFKDTIIHFKPEFGSITAFFSTILDESEALQALCHLAGPLLQELANKMNLGKSPSEVLAYRKLKALSVLAAQTYNKTKKSADDFINHWKKFHGCCGETLPGPGQYGKFILTGEGRVFSVTYTPLVFDTLDRFAITETGAGQGHEITQLVRREEILAAGGVKEQARLCSIELPIKPQQAFVLTA